MMGRQNHLNYANYVLEEWARWMLSADGFSPVSSIAKLGEISNYCNGGSLPNGVELPCREVSKAINVFSFMEESSPKSAKRSMLLRSTYLGRVENESVFETMSRLNLTSRRADYYDSLEEFNIRLEMINS